VNRELAQKIEAALQSARRDHNPNAEDRARVHGALQRALAAPPAPSVAASGADQGSLASDVGVSASARFATFFKLPLLGAVLVIAGVGLWALGAHPPQRRTPRPVPAAQVAPRNGSEPAAAAAHDSSSRALPASPAAPARYNSASSPEPRPASAPIAPAVPHALANDVRSAAPHKSGVRRVAERAAPSQASPSLPAQPAAESQLREGVVAASRSSTWPEELELMRRALAALNAGSTSTALAVLEEHAARHPQGLLRAERLGLRVVALCASGQRRVGEHERALFLREFGELPIARRVRAACSGATQ
jgi:hypothetical protein